MTLPSGSPGSRNRIVAGAPDFDERLSELSRPRVGYHQSDGLEAADGLGIAAVREGAIATDLFSQATVLGLQSAFPLFHDFEVGQHQKEDQAEAADEESDEEPADGTSTAGISHDRADDAEDDSAAAKWLLKACTASLRK